MKISLAWIEEFTDIDSTVEELVDLINSRLVEVEEVINLGERYKGILVAKIIEKEDHPNADKLGVYKISTGNSEATIVAGDKSLEIGDKVGYIPPGSTVPSSFEEKEPFVIEARKLRGVHSEGMFGSAKELGLGQDHSSVLKLDTEADAGTALADVYQLNDIILDIDNKSFTHRPDAFGIIGVAREIAAIQHKEFKTPDWYKILDIDFSQNNNTKPLVIQNNIPSMVPRYMAVSMSDVVVMPSSIMMQSLLIRVGIRPINNIVDITNYIMLLTGQPLHAFDYDKVISLQTDRRTAMITVSEAQDSSSLELLDGKKIDVRPGAILINAEDTPIALGGVMGGADTEVNVDTTNIIIESAIFDMYNIRNTSMTHGIFTDASNRFAKGQSPSQCSAILGHAVGLLLESAGGKISSDAVDIYPEKKQIETIEISSQIANELLGSALTADEMAQLLRNTEFEVKVEDSELIVSVPLWRSDISIAEDVIEEIGRLFGFDELKPRIPKRSFAPVMMSDIEELKSQTRNFLSNAGANEVLTYNFISKKIMEQTEQSPKNAFHLTNSISPELEFLRTNLVGSLLTKVHINHKAGFDEFALYEINKSHNKVEFNDDGLPKEHQNIAFVYSLSNKIKSNNDSGAAFYKAKYYIEKLANKLNLKAFEYRILRAYPEAVLPVWIKMRYSLFDKNRSAVITSDNQIIGIIGEPSQKVKNSLKLPDKISMFECDLEQLAKIRKSKQDYQPLSKFPATEQDICFKFKKDRSYNDLIMAVKDFMHQFNEISFKIMPVDIFQKSNDKEHKQITIRLHLQHKNRTLTTKEVNTILDKLSDKIHQSLRGERV